MDNPLNFIDPDGKETYLILYGKGAVNEDRNGQINDVGALFEDAAKSRAEEIKGMEGFNSKSDKVELKETPFNMDFMMAMNNSYDSGPIKQINIFAHMYSTGINFGGGRSNEPDKRNFTTRDVSFLAPDFAKGASMFLWGCNSANDQKKRD